MFLINIYGIQTHDQLILILHRQPLCQDLGAHCVYVLCCGKRVPHLSQKSSAKKVNNLFSKTPAAASAAVWPDWAIYWTLGNFLKPLATINLPKSPTFLGNFCTGVKIYHFSSEIIFRQFFLDIWHFFLVALLSSTFNLLLPHQFHSPLLHTKCAFYGPL